MSRNRQNLVMRDPALATLMGAIPGSDFGSDFDPNGGNMGYEFGDEYGDDDYGYEFGAEAKAARPPPAAMMQAWAKAQKSAAHTERRARLLEPNKGSAIKVERYAFAVNQTLTLQTAVALDASGSPDVNIRPQRVSINAPTPGFCTISEIKVANVSVTVGGTQDAFDFNANGVGQALDMPTLTPANRARVLGNYTGFLPVGFVAAASFALCISFKGPASIVA